MAADGSCAWRSTVAGRILNIRGFSVALTQPNDLKHCRFDPLSPAALANPYPFYAWLREHDPLHWGIGSSGEEGGCWYITRYAESVAALKDPRLGREIWRVLPELTQPEHAEPPASSAAQDGDQAILEMSRQWMVLRDPPVHTRLRSLVQRAFTPRMIERLRPRMEQIVNELVDQVIASGRMEVLHAFAEPLPVMIIAELLGVPPEDQALFMPWSRALAAVIEFEQSEEVRRVGSAAVVALSDYLRQIIAQRRRQPQDDLISALITIEDEGHRPSEHELIGTITQLLFGGNEPVIHLIGNGLLALLHHPDQLADWRRTIGSPAAQTETAIDELMRYDSSVQMTFRNALEEVALGGKRLQQGDPVAIVMGAANRDPQLFPDPDRLDLARTPNRHLSLGVGIHYCIGAALAKAEVNAAFACLLDRLPDLALATDALQWRRAVAVRGLVELPVIF